MIHKKVQLKKESSDNFLANMKVVKEKQSSEVLVEAFLDENNQIRFSTQIPDPEDAPPIDVCCVVDISDSMSQTASGITDGRTEYIEMGYSLLDLVRHALKTVTKVLRPCDRMSLITFNEQS